MPHLPIRWRPLFLLVCSALLLPACGPVTFTIGGKQAGLEETTVIHEPGHRGQKIAVIDVTGVIINGDRPGLLQVGENPVSLLHEKFRRAANDRDVKAVVLRLNTPGGGVTASDLMYREVVRFREQTGKPVVGLAMDVTASGGYYVACGTDRLIAHPTSVVGSIGVIAQTISVRPALERWGVQPKAITSGPNKAVGSPLENMTQEHEQILQTLVDDFYARFETLVRESRPGISPDQFAQVTDGRVVSGERALELGLVDEMGDIYDAMSAAKTLAGVEHARMVSYHRPLDYSPTPYAAAPSPPGGTQVNLAQINLAGGLDQPVGLYYLWRPELP